MDLFERSVLVWSQMTPAERVLFLDQLKAEVASGQFWTEAPTEDWAAVESFDRLPQDLRGRLMMAVTSSGFSVERYKVCRRVLLNHTRKENIKNGGAK